MTHLSSQTSVGSDRFIIGLFFSLYGDYLRLEKAAAAAVTTTTDTKCSRVVFYLLLVLLCLDLLALQRPEALASSF